MLKIVIVISILLISSQIFITTASDDKMGSYFKDLGLEEQIYSPYEYFTERKLFLEYYKSKFEIETFNQALKTNLNNSLTPAEFENFQKTIQVPFVAKFLKTFHKAIKNPTHFEDYMLKNGKKASKEKIDKLLTLNKIFKSRATYPNFKGMIERALLIQRYQNDPGLKDRSLDELIKIADKQLEDKIKAFHLLENVQIKRKLFYNFRNITMSEINYFNQVYAKKPALLKFYKANHENFTMLSDQVFLKFVKNKNQKPKL